MLRLPWIFLSQKPNYTVAFSTACIGRNFLIHTNSPRWRQCLLEQNIYEAHTLIWPLGAYIITCIWCWLHTRALNKAKCVKSPDWFCLSHHVENRKALLLGLTFQFQMVRFIVNFTSTLNTLLVYPQTILRFWLNCIPHRYCDMLAI